MENDYIHVTRMFLAELSDEEPKSLIKKCDMFATDTTIRKRPKFKDVNNFRGPMWP